MALRSIIFANLLFHQIRQTSAQSVPPDHPFHLEHYKSKAALLEDVHADKVPRVIELGRTQLEGGGVMHLWGFEDDICPSPKLDPIPDPDQDQLGDGIFILSTPHPFFIDEWVDRILEQEKIKPFTANTNDVCCDELSSLRQERDKLQDELRRALEERRRQSNSHSQDQPCNPGEIEALMAQLHEKQERLRDLDGTNTCKSALQECQKERETHLAGTDDLQQQFEECQRAARADEHSHEVAIDEALRHLETCNKKSEQFEVEAKARGDDAEACALEMETLLRTSDEAARDIKKARVVLAAIESQMTEHGVKHTQLRDELRRSERTIERVSANLKDLHIEVQAKQQSLRDTHSELTKEKQQVHKWFDKFNSLMAQYSGMTCAAFLECMLIEAFRAGQPFIMGLAESVTQAFQYTTSSNKIMYDQLMYLARIPEHPKVYLERYGKVCKYTTEQRNDDIDTFVTEMVKKGLTFVHTIDKAYFIVTLSALISDCTQDYRDGKIHPNHFWLCLACTFIQEPDLYGPVKLIIQEAQKGNQYIAPKSEPDWTDKCNHYLNKMVEFPHLYNQVGQGAVHGGAASHRGPPSYQFEPPLH